jgi:hypothetical protein
MPRGTWVVLAITATVLGTLGTAAVIVSAGVGGLGNVLSASITDSPRSTANLAPFGFALAFAVVALISAFLPYFAPRIAAVLMLVAVVGFRLSMAAGVLGEVRALYVTLPTLVLVLAAGVSMMSWFAKRSADARAAEDARGAAQQALPADSGSR